MAQIGNYEILGTLGTGSMGSVYRARDIMLEREVALKTIRTESAVEPEFQKRFFHEARIGARLQHPNIVKVFDLGEAGGLMYLAMELLEGADLRRIIESRQSLPLVFKLKVMIEVCAALHHAHSLGVVHRGIKPSNILIGNDGHAKVLDFGIARPDTSNYLAPEQLVTQTCDSRSDQFAAAIVFFEFLTGAHPFHGLFIPRRIANGEADALRAVDPRLPASLEAVLQRALQNEPKSRYQNCRELAADLEAVLAEAAVEAPPASPESSARELDRAEFFRLLQEFDDAIGQMSAPAARDALAGMKRLADADERFPLLVEEREDRLLQVEDPAPVAAPAPAPTQNLDATQILDEAAARAMWMPPVAAPPLAPRPAPSARASRGTGAVWISLGIILLLAAGAGAALILLPKLHAVAVLHAVGTADVTATGSQILSQPAGQAETVSALRKGDRVNILAAPAPGAAEWLRVQRVSDGKISRPGYVRAADLGNWSTLDLWLSFRPRDTATAAERAAYLAALEAMLARTPDSADVRRARLQIAEQSVLLARAARESGQPAGAWLDRADRALREIQSDPGFQTVAVELRRSVDALRQPVPAPSAAAIAVAPPNPVRAVRYDPEPDYRLAELDWQTGCYANAERRLQRILKFSPDYEKAARLLETVHKAQLVDPGACS